MRKLRKFTPGPWKVVGRNDSRPFIDPVDPSLNSTPDDRHSIAQAFGPDAHANATLITAAPEMYEALKKARETIHALHGDAAWEIYGSDSPEMKIINSAIARAEGRE